MSNVMDTNSPPYVLECERCGAVWLYPQGFNDNVELLYICTACWWTAPSTVMGKKTGIFVPEDEQPYAT